MKNILIASSLVCAAFSTNASLWMFDDFTVNHGSGMDLAKNGIGSESGSTAIMTPGIIGGQRDAELTVTQAGSANPDSTLQAGDPDFPFLSWTNGSGAFSIAEVIYDGGSTAPKNATSFYSTPPKMNVFSQGLNSLDVLNPTGLYTAFFFDVVTSDAAGTFDYYLQVFDMQGGIDQVTGSNSGGVLNRMAIDFSLFNSANVDLSEIGAIAFGFNSTEEGTDISISSWGVIPEPSILAIFGATLLGFGVVTTRRKRKAVELYDL
ncbi:PEP-CTERM sorting domain-containing protein [Photobacterium makurazakiensis]|uniref:PEP-CTERM sorting domain-containing protein n=1 Tax=Photobacterium makurazakiensis TaxID=2910234 RepID=UPI003D14C123